MLSTIWWYPFIDRVCVRLEFKTQLTKTSEFFALLPVLIGYGHIYTQLCIDIDFELWRRFNLIISLFFSIVPKWIIQFFSHSQLNANLELLLLGSFLLLMLETKSFFPRKITTTAKTNASVYSSVNKKNDSLQIYSIQ